ncbi:MAG: MBOAT family protein [Bacteriovoracaceae bacterium]
MSYQLYVIAVFLGAFIFMKWLAVKSAPGLDISFLYRSPVFAPFSQKRNLKKNQASVKRLKERFLFLAVANILGIEFYQFLFSSFTFPIFIKAWLFCPYIYLFTNLLGVSAQALGLLGKELPPDLHNHPYLSKNLSEFWGKRWNTWVRDWLAQTSKRLARSREQRTFLAFVFSGIFHEIIIAVPFYFYTGENDFGLMTSFFFLQYLGVALDKKLLSKKSPALRKPFMWAALLLPMPLFINPAVLAFFGF